MELLADFSVVLHAANEARKALSDADRRRAEAKRAKPQLRQAAELLSRARAAGPACDEATLVQMVTAWLRAMLDLTFIGEENLAEREFADEAEVGAALRALDEGDAWVARLVAVGAAAPAAAPPAAAAAAAAAPAPPRGAEEPEATQIAQVAQTLSAKLDVLQVVGPPASIAVVSAGATGSAAASTAAAKVVGTELWETLCWRRGALRYMAAACAIQQVAHAAEVPGTAPLLEAGVAAIDSMEQARGAPEASGDGSIFAASIDGGTEVSTMLSLGMYSDMHLLACMYAAELAYWRWQQLRGVGAGTGAGSGEVASPSAAAEEWRSQAEARCRRYVYVVETVMGGRGWETTRAKQLLGQLQGAARPLPLRASDGQASDSHGDAARTPSVEAAFTLKTVAERMPSIVEAVVERNAAALDESAIGDLRALAQEMATGAVVQQLAPDGRGHAASATVAAAWNAHLLEGGTWFDQPWWLVENFLYKRILEITRPLLADPFAAQKAEALTAAAGAFASSVLPMTKGQSCDGLAMHLLRSLWGNRADLSLTAGQVTATDFPGESAPTAATTQVSELLADDRSAVLGHIESFGGESRVLVVLDSTCASRDASGLARFSPVGHSTHRLLRCVPPSLALSRLWPRALVRFGYGGCTAALHLDGCCHPARQGRARLRVGCHCARFGADADMDR